MYVMLNNVILFVIGYLYLDVTISLCSFQGGSRTISDQ